MRAPEIGVSVTTSLFDVQHENFYVEDKNCGFYGEVPLANKIVFDNTFPLS